MLYQLSYGNLQFLSTPSARRATRLMDFVPYREAISIHALREEGDLFASRTLSHCSVISIHALREEGDTHGRGCPRRAGNFYPRPPRGGRPKDAGAAFPAEAISIHALREEGDASCASWGPERSHFYPRPPRGGRLGVGHGVGHHIDISIHTLREEGDVLLWQPSSATSPFLSTPSARRATLSTSRRKKTQKFLSTPSARRATPRCVQCYQKAGISIHALREEGDLESMRTSAGATEFLSTPSARRATFSPHDDAP